MVQKIARNKAHPLGEKCSLYCPKALGLGRLLWSLYCTQQPGEFSSHGPLLRAQAASQWALHKTRMILIGN